MDAKRYKPCLQVAGDRVGEVQCGENRIHCVQMLTGTQRKYIQIRLGIVSNGTSLSEVCFPEH